MTTQINMGGNYYFKVEVREGPLGFSGDETYWSKSFTSFRAAYTALVDFRPQREWTHFRYVQRMYIWREGYSKVYVGMMGSVIKVEDLPKLGVTKEEFDKIIEEVWNTTGLGVDDQVD